MATSIENDDFQSLSKCFDEQLTQCFNIETSECASNNQELQNKISKTIKKLEELTIKISYLGVFSDNESIEEISTSSIKFLMLPVLLGSLTLKLLKPPREDVLHNASVYFKDFLKRCHQYQLTTYQDHKEEENSTTPSNAKPTLKDLERMSMQREDKITRYKEGKALQQKVCELKKAIENPSHDEDVLREYFITLINQFIYKSLDELDSLSMEMNMLRSMKQMSIQNPAPKQETNKSFRPFLITKDAAQKKVFGAGYPSLPILSVEEFYEQRVRDGWFPAPTEKSKSSIASTTNIQAEKEESEEEGSSDAETERLRERDEWRDTHRRGWGNTYNRS